MQDIDILGSIHIGAQVTFAKSTSTITVGAATINAAADLVIDAQAVSDVKISTPSLVLGASYVQSTAEAKTDIMSGAQLSAIGTFKLISDVEHTLKLTTKVVSGQLSATSMTSSPVPIPKDKAMKIPGPALAFTWGQGTSSSEADFESGATASANDIVVSAYNSNDFEVTTKSTVNFPKKNMGQAVGVSISDMSSSSDAYIMGNMTSYGDIAISADSINTKNYIDAKAMVNGATTGSGITNLISSKIRNYNTQNQSPGQIGLGAAVVIATSSNTADAHIGHAAQVSSNGALSLTSRVEDNFKTIAVGGAMGGDKVSLGGAVSLGDYTNNAVAYIADQAIVNVGKAVNLPVQTVSAANVNTTTDEINLGANNLQNGNQVVYRAARAPLVDSPTGSLTMSL